jgi:hypothetical protein
MPPARIPELDRETERRLAAGLYNDTWRLLELPKRLPEQDDEMLHQAHASRYHWGRAGQPRNLARGEWMCSRVYATLGRPEQAVWHARRCLEILTEFGDGEEWDLPAAYEALARAYAVAGDAAASKGWIEKAREALKAVANREDARHIEEDLETIPRA